MARSAFEPDEGVESAMLSPWETEMLRWFDWVQRMPSSSQCSQKMRRMSSERFEKK